MVALDGAGVPVCIRARNWPKEALVRPGQSPSGLLPRARDAPGANRTRMWRVVTVPVVRVIHKDHPSPVRSGYTTVLAEGAARPPPLNIWFCGLRADNALTAVTRTVVVLAETSVCWRYLFDLPTGRVGRTAHSGDR